jgi:hypothetical protein
MVTKEHILSEIRRTALDNRTKPLGRKRFEAETGIKESDWYGKFWTKWSDAIKEAGYEPNTMQSAFNPTFLLEKLVSLISELGRFPTSADLRMKSRNDPAFPSHNTFAKLGSKSERAQKIVEYCDAAGNLTSVAEIVRPHVDMAQTEQRYSRQGGEESFGFVYLMRSGGYYKIGRSNWTEKRAYEVQLQLPEELKLVHKIKTDDPIGIEAYWHQRFAGKRKRGEWFALSTEDIRAFRRRKFM